MIDLSIPRNPSLAGTYQAGFAARLAGRSRYSNPYGDRIDLLEEEGRPLGWLHAFLHAWWRGWLAADHMIDDVRPGGVTHGES